MKRLTCIAALLLSVFALLGQDVPPASLQGTVRDPAGNLLSAAKVRITHDGQTSAVESDAHARYRFSDLRPGTYSLHAEAGSLQADFGPLVLRERETRTVDLSLAEAAKPEFFDAPSFIVAGVTDSANRGGHGGDPILRSSESLAKATASLGAGEIQGDALEAIRAFQRTAEADPTESHLFDWGAELLRHRAAEQAADIFSRGNRLFPRSTRMLLGLAAAWYARGSFDQAEKSFIAACDLNPGDPTPYLFLGQARNSPIGRSDGFAERMSRFARLHPDNAWANYYGAVSLRGNDPVQARVLLEKAVRLDPRLGASWLQLGILFADQGDQEKAVAAWQKAAADETAIEAHYRLSQAYRRLGDPMKAKAEIELWARLSKEAAQQEERERSAIREFVFQLRDQGPGHR